MTWQPTQVRSHNDENGDRPFLGETVGYILVLQTTVM